MKKEKYSHLKSIGDHYLSDSIIDAPYMPSKMNYEVHPITKSIEIIVRMDDEDGAFAFIAGKDHIPFLEQMLIDLKEVTK
ncbi:hypothetical protein FCO27_18630 [Bacillus pumilus]|uniref:Uncharacterized protein n=1 Tax=Bacillus zhangzhouensis TaxID=1178540 RepID=A0A081LBG3_9BACI|nr:MULTISPECIES: hypothetical protein [Bacillus]KEP26589.1 hypothetical protein BA70_18530 [Bacillus zhangzhouensis]TKI21743.1 hypothetical protein FCO27_18630 [Bacillus pumilus]UDF17587.1 hypothetical protein LG951_05195 [Bacillus pumilus]